MSLRDAVESVYVVGAAVPDPCRSFEVTAVGSAARIFYIIVLPAHSHTLFLAGRGQRAALQVQPQRPGRPTAAPLEVKVS